MSPARTALARRAEALARRAVGQTAMPQPPLRPTRYPVVLMHGFGALANARAGGVFHDEAMHLRARGVWAYAPHVPPYDTVVVRAAAWAERLERVVEETRAERVNLIAFSSGGLDARHLAGPMGWGPRLASLVTVATPHRGSPLADVVLGQPDALRGAAVSVMDFVGRAAFTDAPPHTADALAQLGPASVLARFDPAETVPGAWCASVAARAGRGCRATICAPLVVTNRILYALAGPNDGIVPAASAHWGEALGTVEADHAALIGLRLPGSARFDSRAFYTSLVDRLRERGL